MFYKKLFELSLAFMVLVLWISFSSGPSTGPTTIAISLSTQTTSPIWSDGEKNCLSQVIWSESRGEPLEGQLAVAIVVINRSIDGRFNPYGKSLCAVAHQKNQFAHSKHTNESSDMIAELATEQYGLIPDNARHWMYFQRSHHGHRIGQHFFH